MKLQYALDRIRDTNSFKKAVEDLKNGAGRVNLGGVSGSRRAFWIAALESAGSPGLVITYNSSNAQEISEELKNFMDGVYFFPSHQAVLYNVQAHSKEVEELRIKVLKEVLDGRAKVVVTSVDALFFPVLPPQRFSDYTFDIRVSQSIGMEELVEKLIASGYEREDMVEGPGQFSIRGGIVDIYPMGSSPYRLEFFGDEVDSIRTVDISTQRSVEKVAKASIYPCRELLITEEEKEQFFHRLRQDLKKTEENLNKTNSYFQAGMLREEVEEIISTLETKPSSYLVSNYWMYGCEAAMLLDYFSEESILVIDNPARVEEEGGKFYKDFINHYTDRLEKGKALLRQREKLYSYEFILSNMENKRIVTFIEILTGGQGLGGGAFYNFATRSMHPFYGKMDLVVEEIKRLYGEGYTVCILVSSRSRGDMLEQELKRADIFPVVYPESLAGNQNHGRVVIDSGFIKEGFLFPDAKLAVFSDKDVFGTFKRKTRVKRAEKKEGIKIFSELSPGDYVVHEIQGIGIYKGIQELKVDGIKRDYLKIEYRGGDILYLPTYQSHLVQKYVGAEGKSPRLSKMGGKEWAKTKAGVKKAVENMARELLELYAARQVVKGHAFNEDTPWQRQFEELFPYQETPDQLRCIQEVKRDMELPKPMDRLLCGDVGYGKTEVAMRAAFKAVMDGKQVAMLVPTTILAQQHYNTFRQRMEQFPVNIEMISRFRTPGQQQEILRRLKEGNIDIIIGTHRVLQKDVVFKDLGLLIVDEEQRFGVSHKEAIKELKKNIDVLTLTATPIPRTLHMALIGIRDISVIHDPPEDRLPVETYVVEYNEELIRDAIMRELNRGGQVYFVHNRVKSIDKVARELKKIVPEASIAVAHGQMDERRLEGIMLDFLDRKYDILLCTTIIETGLDIPNVNTIIVTDADKLGLSQMYQLRGRVGRSNRLAYAYFTYRKDKVLTETAEKRLKAIKEFTEFGSGFRIALRDLEIRGAGNILGHEQHGHMMAVGYDLYCKLLAQTIKELEGMPVEEKVETLLDLKVDAYIPGDYIQDEKQKVEIYRRIATIESLEDYYDVEEEIEDRFGDVVLPVRNLLAISYIKALGQKLDVTSIEQYNSTVKVKFKSPASIKPQTVNQLINEYSKRIKFQTGKNPCFLFKVNIEDSYRMLMVIKGVLEKIMCLQQQ